MVTQTIRVNLNQKDLETILAVQSDSLREIAFEFYATDAEDAEQLDPDDFTVKFNALKPDNNFVMTTFTDGVIKLSDQITAVTGTGYYCILLMQNDELIYSGNGKIIINDHVIGTENIDSVSEADGLVFPDDFYTRDTPIAEIDDSATSTSSTWSSSKIAEEIAAGSGADLIDDTVTSETKTWSSSKISTQISAKATIDDSTTNQTETWSSDKIATELAGKPDVDDTAQNYADTWSSEKINSEIQSTTHIADNAISSNSTWSSQKISNEISAIIPGGDSYSTTEHVVGTWVDGKTVYEKTYIFSSLPSVGDWTAFDVDCGIDTLVDYSLMFTRSNGQIDNDSDVLRIAYNPPSALGDLCYYPGGVGATHITVRYTKTGGN